MSHRSQATFGGGFPDSFGAPFSASGRKGIVVQDGSHPKHKNAAIMKTLFLFPLLLALSLPRAFAQGSLTPPGAPAPTMKSLDQIEPRTPISSLPFTISSSGSY